LGRNHCELKLKN